MCVRIRLNNVDPKRIEAGVTKTESPFELNHGIQFRIMFSECGMR